MSSSKMKVISSDGQEFEIEYDIAKQSKLLKVYFDDDIDEPVQLHHIKASILKSVSQFLLLLLIDSFLVIDFCNHHKNDPEQESIDDDDDDDDINKNTHESKRTFVISEWDRKFVQQFTIREEKLFDIITAASYLDILPMLRVFCRTFITMTRGKSSEEIQELFKICDSLDEITNDNFITSQK